MNYIKHLNTFFIRIKNEPGIRPQHISLYMAIFQHWNYNRFEEVFTVSRKDVMLLAKISSKNTYHRCIAHLHKAGYIRYHYSVIKYLPARVSVTRLDLLRDNINSPQMGLFTTPNNEATGTKNDTAPVPDLTSDSTKNDTDPVPIMGHLIKQTNYKQINSVLGTPTQNNKKNKTRKELEKEAAVNAMKPTLMETTNFFTENGYPFGEGKKFWYYNESRNWQLPDGAAIRQWQPLAHKWMLNDNASAGKQTPAQNIHTSNDKNYNEPL